MTSALSSEKTGATIWSFDLGKDSIGEAVRELKNISPNEESLLGRKKAGYSVEHCPLNLIIAAKRTTSSDQLPPARCRVRSDWSS